MEERKVTVYRGSTKDYSPVPRITLQGQWLDSLGFSIGDRLTVGCERGRLIIEKSETESIEIGMVAEVAVRYKQESRI
ncbi:MAG: type I toxin-antitoxin system SymE family toxin [Lachnospiraceae bacterium]|nr:type I toxin-antitoxin system SymE family toxin [Lachnospiraceae bacterium]MCM1239874.1 type I toxin-antitoxin system SymE family toxin [Lachnospiraceae bacterium]